MPFKTSETFFSIKVRLLFKALLVLTAASLVCFNLYKNATDLNVSLKDRDTIREQERKVDESYDSIENIIPLYINAFQNVPAFLGNSLDDPLQNLVKKTDELATFSPELGASVKERIQRAKKLLESSQGSIQKGDTKKTQRILYESYNEIATAHNILKNYEGALGLQAARSRTHIRSLIESNPYNPLWALLAFMIFVFFIGATLLIDPFMPMKNVAEHMIKASKDPLNAAQYLLKTSRLDEIGITERALNNLLMQMQKSIKEAHELQNQFLHVQKMESVGRLTGGIAHDFNNMLTIINGNLDMLVNYVSENSPINQYIDTAKRAVGRGSELTHRLLAFSRSQALNPKVINLNIVIPETTMLIIRAIGEQIEIIYDLAEDLANAEVDIGQLENALINLAINARDAMPEGGFITIKTENVFLDESHAIHEGEIVSGDYVMVSVTDTGCGIPEHIKSQVFDPFFTTKEVGEGSGLGLSMVYGFAKQSGGHIEIESETGKGTSVRLYFPRSKALPLAELIKKGKLNLFDDDPEKSLRGAEIILVVEDEPEILNMNRKILTQFGYTVHCAPNGNEALFLLKEIKKIDLLLTDVVMPGNIDGPFLAEKIQEAFPNVKILFISGYAPKQAASKNIVFTDANLLPKPYTSMQLVQRVRMILDN